MQPHALNDDVFGELSYDPPLEEWYTSVEPTPGHPIDVTIGWREHEDGPVAPVLARARESFSRFCECEPLHRQALAVAMLERYRRSARPCEKLPAPSALAQALVAKQLSIAADGSAIVHYDDNTELFADHVIMVDLNAEGSFSGFTLQG
jgi:hypothetical protein